MDFQLTRLASISFRAIKIKPFFDVHLGHPFRCRLKRSEPIHYLYPLIIPASPYNLFNRQIARNHSKPKQIRKGLGLFRSVRWCFCFGSGVLVWFSFFYYYGGTIKSIIGRTYSGDGSDRRWFSVSAVIRFVTPNGGLTHYSDVDTIELIDTELVVRQNANTCASKYVDIAFEREKKTKKKTQNTTVFEAQNEMMDWRR